MKNRNKFTQDEAQKLTQEELVKINELNSEFNKAKMAVGDVELQKQNILRHIELLKTEFSAFEKSLIEKYGVDSVINVQTGEITKKQD